DAEVERATDGLPRFVGVERAPVTAERPRSKRDRGNLEIGLAESDVPHVFSLVRTRALSRHAASSGSFALRASAAHRRLTPWQSYRGMNEEGSTAGEQAAYGSSSRVSTPRFDQRVEPMKASA